MQDESGFPPRERRRRSRKSGAVTIEDVARLACVSIKTVSRVLNAEPNVREETKARVDEAVRSLKYRPNLAARHLASSRADIIGLVYDNPSDSYIINIQHGVLDAAEALRFSLILIPCDYADPGTPQRLLDLIDERQLAGLMLTPPVGDVDAVLQALDERGLPYVSMSPARQPASGLKVAVDDFGAARDMTAHLLALGHSRIGFIIGHPDHGSSVPRLDGFRAAMNAAGAAIEPELLAQGRFTFESGAESARTLLALPSRPTAIFASNDDMAAGVLHVAHEMGIQIPGDLSVVGFDDVPLAEYVWPSLSTVRQPIRDMARVALARLVAHIRKRGDVVDESQESFDYQLILRQSSGRPAKG